MNDALPENRDAEMACLGSMLMSADSVDAASTVIADPGAFFLPAHQVIFDLIVDLRRRGKPIDFMVLQEDARRRQMADAFEPSYLVELAESFADTANATYYAELVWECFQKRQIIAVANAIRARALETTSTASEIVAEFAPQLDSASATTGENEPQEIRKTFEALPEWWERTRAESIQTGIIPLDSELGGFERPSYVIIGARPSVGKSSLLLHISLQANAAGAGVLFFVLEAGGLRTAQRFAGHLSGHPAGHLKRHASPADRQHAIFVAKDKLTDAPLYLADKQVSLQDILATSRLYIRRHGIKVVIIDYVQIVKAPKADTRDLQIGQISDALRRLSLDSDVVVIAAAQLRRGTDVNRAPGLEQLRESGNLEQDADVAILLHRAVADKYSERMIAEVDLDVIVAKNKDGPTPAFTLRFHKPTFAFSSSASQASDEAYYHPEPAAREELPF